MLHPVLSSPSGTEHLDRIETDLLPLLRLLCVCACVREYVCVIGTKMGMQAVQCVHGPEVPIETKEAHPPFCQGICTHQMIGLSISWPGTNGLAKHSDLHCFVGRMWLWQDRGGRDT